MLQTRLYRRIAGLGIWLAVALFASAAGAKPEYQLKFATLAPPGSTWMILLEEWAKEVTQLSQGRLGFKFYPGGVHGDEPDVLKKIRLGVLHGGAFSGHGVGAIYSPARVMELPFLFENFAEIDHVRDHFTPRFEQGFRDKGYELLGWMEIGFVHMFSKEPIHRISDLKTRRVWLWQGDPMGQALFNASGISPVPLSIIDVFTSLSTGLVDTVYSTPLASIAMQWFTKTDYVSETALTNAMGAMVVSQRFYQKLPPDLQQILKETGMKTGERLIAATRADNEKSVAELKARGLTFVDVGAAEQEQELREITDRASKELMESGYIPAALIAEVRALVDRHRNLAAHQQPVTAVDQ